MSLIFDGNGVQTNTYAELFTRLDDGYRVIYGPDIDTDQESPDGQRIGIEATLRFDTESAFSWLYSGIDPDLNNGDMQQVIAKLAGVYLLPASRSQWDLVVESDRTATLPSGYTITDKNNQEWFLDSDVPVAIGDNNITFLSKLWGAIAGTATGAEFTQATPELGVKSIAALGNALIGREEETTEKFRVRRQRSTENPAQSTVGAIYAKLAQLNGVTDLQVYDNSESIIDTERDIPPHTMWAIVEGGSLDDIGEVMAKQRLGGTKGAVDVTYLETLTKPNGDALDILNIHKIDRPVYLPLYVRLTATQKTATSPIDSEAIKNNIAAYITEIGVAIQAAELSPSSYIDNYNYIVSGFELSLDGANWTDQDATPGYQGKFVIDVANITVTEVPA